MTFFCTQNSGKPNIPGSAVRMAVWIALWTFGFLGAGIEVQGACLSDEKANDAVSTVAEVMTSDADNHRFPGMISASNSEKIEPEGESKDAKTPIGKDTDCVKRSVYSGSRSEVGTLFSSLGALALTLGAFFGLVYLTKLLVPRRARRLSGNLEILESCPVDSKNELVTIRWGQKLVLAAKSPGSWTLLSESSDPEEVERYVKETDSQRQLAKACNLGRLFCVGHNDNPDGLQDKDESQQN